MASRTASSKLTCTSNEARPRVSERSSTRTATEKLSPGATWRLASTDPPGSVSMLTRGPRPSTATGMLLLVVVPLPSWPLAFSPQQVTSPMARAAHEWLLPAPMAITPLSSPTTCTGVALLMRVPSPSWPKLFAPQQRTPPPAVRTQVWLLPPAMAAIPLVRPAISVGVGPPWLPQHLTPPAVVRAQVYDEPAASAMASLKGAPPGAASTSTGVARLPPPVPSPSCPELFLPQHLTPGVEVSAQVWLSPPARLMAFVRPVTDTGVDRFAVVPSPSCPWELLPQHRAPPASVTAQLWKVPAPALAAPLVRPMTSIGASRSVVVPSPTSPKPLRPQHLTPPAEVRAQPWKLPAAISSTSGSPGPPPRPSTPTGRVRCVVVPSPSSPKLLRPQHLTPPVAVRAHVWPWPRASDVTSSAEAPGGAWSISPASHTKAQTPEAIAMRRSHIIAPPAGPLPR